jgi:hypothetical protein
MEIPAGPAPPAWRRALGAAVAIDARFRKEPPRRPPSLGAAEPAALRWNFREAGWLGWLFLVQALATWASIVFAPLFAPDYDVFFHLSHGRYQALAGEIPREAYFSFLERPFLDYYWLYQKLAYFLWQLGGPAGLVSLRGVLFSLMLALLGLFLFGRRLTAAGRLGAALVFCLVAWRLTLPFANSRPFVFSYLLLLVFLFILERKPRLLPWLPWLAILWINLHGTEFPVMVAVLLVYLGDELLVFWRAGAADKAASRRRCLWLLASLPAVCCSPHGIELVRLAFRGSALASLYVAEMHVPSAESLASFAFGPAAPPLPFGNTALLFLLGLAALLRALQKRRLQPAHLLLFLAGCCLVLLGYRFEVEFALLALPLLAGGFLGGTPGRRPVLASLVVALVLGVYAWQAARSLERAIGKAYPFAYDRFPYGVAGFLAEVAPPGGRIFNNANYGGFLLWQLGDRHQLFMDTEAQAIFTDDDFFAGLTMMYDRRAWAAFAAVHRPDWVAVGQHAVQSPSHFERSEDFVPVAFDDSLVLLADRRRHPALAETWRLRAIDPWRAAEPGYELESAEAVAEAERLFALERRGRLLPWLLASAAAKRGDFAAAEKYLEALLELSPDDRAGRQLGEKIAAGRAAAAR